MPREIQFMELAKKCTPEEQAKPNSLSHDETKKIIGEKGQALKQAKVRLERLLHESDQLRLTIDLARGGIEVLQQEILDLSASIHPVTVVKRNSGKRSRPSKSEREELLDIMLNMSEKDINEFQAHVRKGK